MTPPRLVQLPGAVTVTVTREEDHQDVLSRYRFPEVVAELAWCTVRTGKHRGERAIEVRLDGHRVGELTHAMSQRYGRMVDTVLAQGNRPGCAAQLEYGERGYQVELRLPRVTDQVPLVPVPTQYVPQASAPQAVPAAAKASRKAKIWTGVAAVVGLLIVIGALNSPDKAPPQNQQAADLRVTTTTQAPVAPEPATDTTEATTTTTTTTTTTKAKPKPPVVTTKKRVTTRHTTTKRKAPSNCDPNYSGCVPIASDVDCAGGSGNGPAYVSGPVEVTGSDIYDLDRDGDGIACE